MSENYKFVQNPKCEYFPCHKVEDKENFNCLFCYCPLYALKSKCGGNFKYAYGIKDCSDCRIPHVKGKGYDYIRSRIEDILELGSER
jgi:Zn-finger protein